MKRATRLVAVIAMLSLMAGVACSSKSNNATTKKTLKIAFLGALTGDNAQLEIHASQGAGAICPSRCSTFLRTPKEAKTKRHRSRTS